MQSYRINERHRGLSEELTALMGETETATVGHVEHVGFVSHGVLPVFAAKAAGSAVTVAAPGRDGTVIYRAVDLLMPGDFLVIARVDGDDVACVGGGVATAVKARGAVGIVIDGPCTDADEIAALGLPVWCRGISSKTTNRRVSLGGSINEPVACGGAAVLPGYAVLADREGVFVAPRDRMLTLTRAAIARQQTSLAVRRHLAAGHSIFDFQPDSQP